MLLIYFIYFAACLVLATIGRNRKFGFWGYLFASLLFSPVIGIFLVLASDPRPPVAEPTPRKRVVP